MAFAVTWIWISRIWSSDFAPKGAGRARRSIGSTEAIASRLGHGVAGRRGRCYVSHRELQVSLTQMEKALERVRERRRLAGQGVFLQQDGKEPEWSWRSIDEIELEAARVSRAVSDAQEELSTAGLCWLRSAKLYAWFPRRPSTSLRR